MRLHRSERLQAAWYSLPVEIRGFIEGLKKQPRPEGARQIEGYPNLYEEFIAGVWVGWEIDDTTGETTILVTISE